MADVFSHVDAKSLTSDKHILYLGDSNVRALYKDLVWLLNYNTLIPHVSLRSKLERSYLGDTLVRGSKLHHGRSFQEVRKYIDNHNRTVLEYIFLPRCYTKDLEELFRRYKRDPTLVPDVIIMNSSLWDVSRWGPNGVPEFKDNMVKLMRLMTQSLPKECLVIWTTALPAAAHLGGGLIIKQIEFMQPLLRFEVMEANTFAREIVASHGFDVLDFHYHIRMQMHRRAKDGVHYMPIPVRLLTNKLLTHFCLSWGVNLPGNVSSVLLDKAIALDSNPVKVETPVKIPNTGLFARINLHSPVVSKSAGIRITFNTEDSIETARRCDLFAEEQVDSVRPLTPEQFGDYSWHRNDQTYSSPDQRCIVLPRYWNQEPLQAFLPQSENRSGPYRRRNRNRRRENERKNPYRKNYNFRF